MKIVGFEVRNTSHLGIVDGDQVIDLQAVDPRIRRDLGDRLRANNGDLKPLKALAEKAPAAARRPLAGLKYTLPVARPGKILCLGLNYMDHVKEGRYAENVPKWPSLFFRVLSSLVPHGAPPIRPLVSEQFDYPFDQGAV